MDGADGADGVNGADGTERALPLLVDPLAEPAAIDGACDEPDAALAGFKMVAGFVSPPLPATDGNPSKAGSTRKVGILIAAANVASATVTNTASANSLLKSLRREKAILLS